MWRKTCNHCVPFIPISNRTKTEESATEGGSQIVSMAETVAKDLGIAWDPDIKIHMQSANKLDQVDPWLSMKFENLPIKCY